jgi:ribosome modulation factor
VVLPVITGVYRWRPPVVLPSVDSFLLPSEVTPFSANLHRVLANLCLLLSLAALGQLVPVARAKAEMRQQTELRGASLMKRQKRSHSERAFSRGYEAGVTGRSRSLCPFDQGEARMTWLTGWREGREDNWSGITGSATAQKLSNL